MTENNMNTIVSETIKPSGTARPGRLKVRDLCKEGLDLVEDDSKNELISYLNYVCDSAAHRPFIPANLVIRAECASDALSFAKWLINTEGKIKGQKITVAEREEEDLSRASFVRQNMATEERILLVSKLLENKCSQSDIRNKIKNPAASMSQTWLDIGKVILRGEKTSARIIVCTTYDRAQNRFDDCSDGEIKELFKKIFNYNVVVKPKSLSEINEAFAEKFRGRYILTSSFKETLAEYNKNNYAESSIKGSDYVDFISNKIIKGKYGNASEMSVFTAKDVPFVKRFVPSEESKEEAMLAINSLTGLGNVKKLLKELEGVCRLNADEVKEMYLNFVFAGNPGTGKTKVAHMMADLLKSLGVIRYNKVVEITPLQLIGHYIGDAQLCVKDTFEQAKGGVLFIDEAYGLNPKGSSNNLKSFKEDALAILLKAMENNRRDITVIFAGYGDEMNQMLEANPGLKSRIYRTVEFEDYSEPELLEIFKAECENGGYTYGDETLKKAGEKLHILKYDKSFGNARTVKTVFQQACMAHLEEDPSRKELYLKPEYIVIENALPDYDSTRVELDALVGLESVKRNIDEIAALCRYNACTGKQGVPAACNMLFRGNPGTGKTTVAKLFGNMLFSLGAVKAPRFVSINAYELKEGVVKVEERLKEYCRKAMGGVLFIDEAYAMGDFFSSQTSDAISVLLDMMENHRDDLVIIFAGYADKMEKFFEKNPGLGSRVPLTLDFEDYTPEQLEDIFIALCEKNGFTVTNGALEMLRDTLEDVMHCDDFANARTVRNIFERAYKNHAVRFVENGCEENELSEKDMDMEDLIDESYVPMGFC